MTCERGPLRELISQHHAKLFDLYLFILSARRDQNSNTVPFGDAGVTCEFGVFLFVSKHGLKSLLPLFPAAVPAPSSK